MIYAIHMKSIHIYPYMLVCENCAVRYRYRVWNILHDVALASSLQKSVCHAGLSYDTTDILLSIVGDKCCGVDVSTHVSVASVAVYATQCCLSIAVKPRYDAQRYLKYWAKFIIITRVTWSPNTKYISANWSANMNSNSRKTCKIAILHH